MKEKNFKVSFLLNFYGELLTDKQRDALEMYYDEDMSLAEIAEHTGITRQGVRDCIKRGESIIFDMEDKLNLTKHFENMEDNISKILNCSLNIKEENSKFAISAVIDNEADKIIKYAKDIID